MIVVLTALPVECEAVRAHLTEVTVHRHSAGTLFDVGRLTSHRDRQVALAMTGAGGLTAATLTERAIAEFTPAAVIFVGVAGGLRDWLEFGDIVVATKMYAYQGGRSEDGQFLARPRAWEMSHVVQQLVRRIPRDSGWRASLPDDGPGVHPAVHFEPVAAGDVVLGSAVSPLRQQLTRNYNDAVAIEMEGAGFALAGHLNGNVPMAVVRAISDRADGTKSSTDRQGWQPIAARNAAAFAVALAAALDEQDQRPGRRGNAARRTAETLPSVRNSNIARGQARVGQQIGISLGNLGRAESWMEESG